jgi:hypothetical protein
MQCKEKGFEIMVIVTRSTSFQRDKRNSELSFTCLHKYPIKNFSAKIVGIAKKRRLG